MHQPGDMSVFILCLEHTFFYDVVKCKKDNFYLVFCMCFSFSFLAALPEHITWNNAIRRIRLKLVGN